MTSVPNSHARISLTKVFSAALMGIVLIFILLSYFTFTRLLNFESALVNVSDESLPNLVLISHLNGQAAKLLESTTLLSKSSSHASKRVAEQQLRDNLNFTRRAAKNILKNEFLDSQLNTIVIELDEFSTLIEERLQTTYRIESLREQMYDLNVLAKKVDGNNATTWGLGFSQALVAVSRALNEKRLQRVRFLFNQLKQQLSQLSELDNSDFSQPQRQELTNQLRQLLFSKDGMETSKIKSLRLQGRALGRENFVHNLIVDYVSQMEFLAHVTEQNITLQATSSVSEMQQQTQQIRFILIGGIVLLLVVVFLFQQRVLKRISVFNQMVRNETLGLDYQTRLGGNDEITDLAATFKEFTQTIDRQKQEFEKLSMSDGLTGIANRRALDIRLKHDLMLSARQKSHVSILLMDIDCFKLYNDNYGHQEGDQCLQNITKVICDALPRDCDFVARYGGEEFVCVLPNTDSSGAQEIAKNVIEKLRNLALPHEYSNVAEYVTLSIGIATSHPYAKLTPETIIKQADNALYAAKEAGKDAFQIFS